VLEGIPCKPRAAGMHSTPIWQQMADNTNNNESSTGAPRTREFRLPSLDVAAAEFQSRQSRAMQGPVGCLFLLVGLSIVVTFLFFLESRQTTILAIGLAVFLLGVVLVRGGGGIVGAWMAALGFGSSIAAAMSLAGANAAWIYWSVAVVLVIIGFAIAASSGGVSPGFFRSQSARSNCRIGFFRPFNAEYSAEAKNLLFPMLSGYGSVYFVADESFDEADFDGLWSKDYEALPGLVGGHRYTNEEWQRQVATNLDSLDIAVVDISVPSTSVIWEIKQCYDRLPSHRIVFVVSAAALSIQVPLDVQDESMQRAVSEHIMPILEGLSALEANPTTKPIMLVYAPVVEGEVWLANALFQAMSNIVAIETGATPAG